MSQINVNRIKDSNEGAPDFPSGVNVSGVTSTVTLGVTNLTATNLNVLGGVCTATTFDGSLSGTGTPTLGLGVTINASGLNISGVATAGIVSATTLYGDGQYITGIAASIAPLNYNPAVFSQASHLTKALGIGLTFNQGVKAGSGNVTLSLANAGVAGTVVENFSVGSSVTYSNGDTITITPTADLSVGQNYHLSYPSGAFTNIGGDLNYVGTAYTFQARTYSYQLWGWGSNERGQLAQNIVTQISSPVQIPGTTWSSIGVNGNAVASYATKTDGTLWSWGKNDEGQLGQNQAEAQLGGASSPVQIPGDWAGAAASTKGGFAVKTNGTLWTWGKNGSGALGLNQPDTTRYSSPVQVPGTTWNASKFRSGSANVITVKTDGTLFAWGSNTYGQLGDGSTTQRSSPTQIPGTTWTQATINGPALATKTDGTLWTWGNNSRGELGHNNRTQYSSPKQVPGTNWTTSVTDGMSLAITDYNMAAIKTDGTLWAWGRSSDGQGGWNSSNVEYSSPVQIPGTTWRSIEGGGGACYYAQKTDGTMWSWGHNEQGQLGQGDRIQQSSPVQIPGTDWNYVHRASDKYGLAIKKI